MAFDWTFELFDKMSGPSRKMESSLSKLEHELDATTGALNKLDRAAAKARLAKEIDPLKKQRIALALHRDELRLNRAAMMDTAKAAATANKAFEAEAASGSAIISGFATAAGGAALVGLGLAAAGTKWAVDTIAFKENTLTSLEVMTGTKAEAKSILQEAVSFADVTPFETADVLTGFTTLLGAGFKRAELSKVYAAVGDAMSASGGDKQVGDRMVLAFAQIKAKGKLQGEEMMQLNESLAKAGVGTKQIYEQLSKVLGVNVDQVQKLQAAGKIDADTGIFAILKAMEARGGGKVGANMAAQSKSLTGLVSTLVSAPASALFRSDAENGEGFGALKGTIENLTRLFDGATETGQKFQRVMTEMIDDVLTGLFGMTSGEGGFKSMEEGFNAILDSIDASRPARKALLEDLGMIASAMVTIVTEGGKMAGAFNYLWEAMGEESTKGVGRGVVNAAMGPLGPIASMVGVAEQMQDAFKAEQQINSPSRVFAGYGRFLTEGLAEGVEDGSPGASSAVQGMVQQPTLRAGALGGGRQLSVTIGSISVPVTGGSDAPDFLERLAAAAKAAVVEAIEEVAVEMGGA